MSWLPCASWPAGLSPRVAGLVAHFEAIARTRMAGVPLLNPALAVEAVGFAIQSGEEQRTVATGILLTPWFMNLVRLPLQAIEDHAEVGRAQLHEVGPETFDFIGAHEDSIGAYAACSLFSPMFEFATQAAARETALAVLDALRRASTPRTGGAEPVSARRSFLFGRGLAPAAAR